jgi:predicted naringenin-chalcone synthase
VRPSLGERVIERACELMGLAMQVAHSRRVLQRYGNMLSAAIVFVLEELMRSQAAMCGDWGLSRLEPGFAAEGHPAPMVANWRRIPPHSVQKAEMR